MMPNKSKVRSLLLVVLLLLLCLTILLSILIIIKQNENLTGPDYMIEENYATEFDKKIGELKKKILSDKNIVPFDGVYAVYISLSNTIEQARVFVGSAHSLSSAWNDAETKLRNYVKENSYDAVWLKAESISRATWMSTEELFVRYSKNYNLMYRKCLAFDNSFENFILEGELMSNNIIDVDKNIIMLDKLNSYFESVERSTVIKTYPAAIIAFNCNGYFADENAEIYTLYSDSLNTGRRVSDTPDADQTLEMVSSASSFLVNLLDGKGRFIYGYYPTSDSEIEDYNILRHAGTIWSMICQYKINKNPDLPAKIRLAIDYMLAEYTGKTGGYYIEMNDTTSFIVERKVPEIKLGGNAVAIVALTEYINTFGKDDEYYDHYANIVTQLANGILYAQNDDGSYNHIFNISFDRTSAYRTVYYDGEATFALSRAYSLTKDARYLAAAEKAIEMFIREDYTQYRDHWVAYALNEVTKYSPKEEYFNFALRNASNSLDVIYNQKTSYHTYMELLMASFELYDRIITENIKVSGLKNFDIQALIDTIFKRANYMLNSYTYPELIMYMKNPQSIYGAFFVRHDEFRVRIDDVQHFVGGYYTYYVNYEKILYYRNLEK